MVYIAPAAMGYTVYLYILHDIEKAFFCDCDPINIQEDSEGETMAEISSSYGMNTLKNYGTEIEYSKAIQIYNILKGTNIKL